MNLTIGHSSLAVPTKIKQHSQESKRDKISVRRATRAWSILIGFLLAVGSVTVFGQPTPSVRNDHGRIQEPELISRSSRSRDATNREEEPPLLQAAQTGDEAKVKELLLAGASVNIRDSFGNTALMRASNQSHSHVVKLLIASHAAVNAANKNGFSALMYAADEADLESIQALVEAGASVNAKSTAGFTPLYMVLRSLCEHEQNCTRTKSIMELLISKGADVNAQTEDGDTILMAASELGHITAVNVLLKSGAEVNSTNSSGQTALCLAEKEENDEIASRLRSLGAEGCSGARLRAADRPGTSKDQGLKLRDAVRAGDEATVKDLLAVGADIETADAIGYTPLILAVEWSHPNVVKLLIDSHARVNAAGTNGFTALMFAAEHGDLESAERLVAAGADVRARTKFGSLTALAMAFAERCSSERACARVKSIAELLILKGADVNAETDDQGTALMNAVGVRNVAAVRVLLSAGADVNKRDASGDTALCVAIREGYPEIAAVLRAGGAKECSTRATIPASAIDGAVGTSQSSLELSLNIIGAQYCAGDSELDSLRLRTLLVYMNRGNENLIVYTGTPLVSRIMVGRTFADLGAKRFEINSSLTTVTSGGENCYKGTVPSKCFITLAPGASYQAETTIGIFAVRGDAREIAGAVQSGQHVLQAEVLGWHESNQLAEELSARWRRFGAVWSQPLISLPTAFTVAPHRTLADCQ